MVLAILFLSLSFFFVHESKIFHQKYGEIKSMVNLATRIYLFLDWSFQSLYVWGVIWIKQQQIYHILKEHSLKIIQIYSSPYNSVFTNKKIKRLFRSASCITNNSSPQSNPFFLVCHYYNLHMNVQILVLPSFSPQILMYHFVHL